MNWSEINWNKSAAEIATEMGVTKARVYQVLNQMRDGLGLPRIARPRGRIPEPITIAEVNPLDSLVGNECAVCKQFVYGEVPVGWIEWGDEMFCSEEHYRKRFGELSK